MNEFKTEIKYLTVEATIKDNLVKNDAESCSKDGAGDDTLVGLGNVYKVEDDGSKVLLTTSAQGAT